MPVQNTYKVAQAEGGRDFVALEADVYQVEISDITLEEGIADPYKPGQTKDQFVFALKVVDPENRCAALRLWATAKWFDGGKTPTKSSKYYQIVTAVDGFYNKGEKNNAVDALSGTKVNSMIGKQMRVNVIKQAASDGRFVNKITGFMSIKKELPAIGPDEQFVPKAPDEDVFPPEQ